MCDRGCYEVLKGSKLGKVFSSQQAPVLQNSWMTVATSEDRINTHKTDCSRHHTPETQPQQNCRDFQPWEVASEGGSQRILGSGFSSVRLLTKQRAQLELPS